MTDGYQNISRPVCIATGYLFGCCGLPLWTILDFLYIYVTLSGPSLLTPKLSPVRPYFKKWSESGGIHQMSEDPYITKICKCISK